MTYLWIALGGALGSMARFWLGGVVTELLGARFPWGTLLINAIGSFVIGWFAVLGQFPAVRVAIPDDARIFVTVGLCGGFTTFSAFSLQTLELLRRGDTGAGLAYIAASVLLCLVAVWAGTVLAKS